MSGVWMRHPELPDEQLIEVPEEAVPHHVRSGWQRVDEAVAEAAEAQRDAHFSQPDPDGDASEPRAAEPAEPTAGKRRRRTADTE